MPTRRPRFCAVPLALALLCATSCNQSNAISERPQTATFIDVAIPGKTIHLSADRWESLRNEFDWAVNFQEKQKSSRQRDGRVVTVFKLPMSDDRRVGSRISSAEYLELFVVDAGTLTIQLRVDKGGYWVMSRETVDGPVVTPGFNLTQLASLYDQDFKRAHEFFQTEIDTTRFLLQSMF